MTSAVGTPKLNLSSAINIANKSSNDARTRTANESINIANADVPGASRQESVSVLDSNGKAVLTSPARISNPLVNKDLRDQTSRCLYLDTLFHVGRDVQTFLGGIHGTTLSNALNQFQTAQTTLANAPESLINQQNLMSAGKQLADLLSNTSNQIRATRQACDTGIYDAACRVNNHAQSILNLNQKIDYAVNNGFPSGSLEDARDACALAIAADMTITSYSNGGNTWRVVTATDVTLVDGINVVDLTFSKSNIMDSTAPLGDLFLGTTNITKDLSGGRIAAFLKSRDENLPKLQAELDELTLHVRDTVNSVHNQGGGFPPVNAFIGQRPIANTAAAFHGAGILRFAVVDAQNGHYVDGADIDLSTLATFDDVRGAIGSIPGVTAAFDIAGRLTLTANNPGQGIMMAGLGSATETTTNLGFSHYFGLNDFFVTPGSYAGDGAAIADISARIAVRNDIAADPSRISRGSLDITLPIQPGNVALWSGGCDVISKLNAAFNAPLQFNGAGNLPLSSMTITDYAKTIVTTESMLTNNLDSTIAAEKIALDDLEAKQSGISGIDIQDSFKKILEAQRALRACMFVIKTSNQMIDDILSIANR